MCSAYQSKNLLDILPTTDIEEDWGIIQPLLPPMLIYKDFGTEETEMQSLITASMGLCTLQDHEGTFVQIILAETYQFIFFKLDKKRTSKIAILTRLVTEEVIPTMELITVVE